MTWRSSQPTDWTSLWSGNWTCLCLELRATAHFLRWPAVKAAWLAFGQASQAARVASQQADGRIACRPASNPVGWLASQPGGVSLWPSRSFWSQLLAGLVRQNIDRLRCFIRILALLLKVSPATWTWTGQFQAADCIQVELESAACTWKRASWLTGKLEPACYLACAST